MVKSHYEHLNIFFATCLLFMSSIVLFNIVIDPYNIFTKEIKKRPTELKTKDYLTKTVKIIQTKPDQIILGTSIVDVGYALAGSLSVFDNVNFNQDKKQLEEELPINSRVFNGGIHGGTLYEMYQLLQHTYLNNKKLKHVIIGLDWHIFTNERPPTDHKQDIATLKKTHLLPLYYADAFMTWAGTRDAYLSFAEQHKIARNINKIFLKVPMFFDRLLSNIKHYASKENYGSTNALEPDVIPDYFNPPQKQYVIGRLKQEMTALLLSIYYISSLYADFAKQGEKVVLNPEAFDYLQKIVNFAHQNNIKLDVYITPQQGTHWVTAEKFGLGSYVDQWLFRVAQITPYWDFSARIDFNDEVTDYFRGDDRHFNTDAGKIILTSIMRGQANPKIGINYVTKDTVQQSILRRHQAQADWLSHNKYLADIFSYPEFGQMRHCHGDIQKLLVHYNPCYHQYHIFQFMGKYVAIPAKYAPYDFRRFITQNYPQMMTGTTLNSVIEKIDMHG